MTVISLRVSQDKESLNSLSTCRIRKRTLHREVSQADIIIKFHAHIFDTYEKI
jgi:hypothetical protein